jgi:hypothetical protein
MTFSINWDRFNGFVFSRGVRPTLNSLPATDRAQDERDGAGHW